MGKIAFVFPGQGAQHPGMGRGLYESSNAARQVLDTAERLRPGTLDLMFSGTKDQLECTSNTQPALFTVDLACAAALTERKVCADGAAGFSLGEIAALAFCNVLEYESAFSLACARGRLMQACAEKHPGFMAAVLRMDNDTVERLCRTFTDIYPVNYNAPGQLTVAGAADSAEAFFAAVQQNGGRALRLGVGGAFHCPFMDEASSALAALVDELELRAPRIPLYSNVTALPYGDARALVPLQMKSPVLWQKTIENMVADGFDTFIECGPGNVLGNLIGKISPAARTLSVADGESLKKTCAALEVL